MAQERWQFPCLTPIVVQDALRGLAGLSRISGMDAKPVNLTEALASFDDVYSPRIVARMNDYNVRIAHTKGEHVWHVHNDTWQAMSALTTATPASGSRPHTTRSWRTARATTRTTDSGLSAVTTSSRSTRDAETEFSTPCRRPTRRGTSGWQTTSARATSDVSGENPAQRTAS